VRQSNELQPIPFANLGAYERPLRSMPDRGVWVIFMDAYATQKDWFSIQQNVSAFRFNGANPMSSATCLFG